MRWRLQGKPSYWLPKNSISAIWVIVLAVTVKSKRNRVYAAEVVAKTKSRVSCREAHDWPVRVSITVQVTPSFEPDSFHEVGSQLGASFAEVILYASSTVASAKFTITQVDALLSSQAVVLRPSKSLSAATAVLLAPRAEKEVGVSSLKVSEEEFTVSAADAEVTEPDELEITTV